MISAKNPLSYFRVALLLSIFGNNQKGEVAAESRRSCSLEKNFYDK